MLTLITVVHLSVAVLLVITVLLQDSKGGALGMGGGGGSSQSLFGATGASNFLVTATRWLGVIFAVTCITLTYYSTHKDTSVTDDLVPAAAAPVVPAIPGQPAAATAPVDAKTPAADAKAATPETAAPAPAEKAPEKK